MNCEDVTFLQSLILALVQGGTEFLPISSSAHLILVSEVMGWADQGLVFDVAVHLGTLFAVLVYFRDDLVQLLKDWFKSCLLYTSPSPRDLSTSRMPSSA